MSRYVRKALNKPLRSDDEDWWDQGPMLPQITVSEPEDVDTGLIWTDGSPIYRTALPIGFGRDDEW